MSFTGGYMLEALVKRTHQESPTRRFVHLIVIFEAEQARSVVRLWACSVLGLWTLVNLTDSHWRSWGRDLVELRDTDRDIRIRI